jgi:signal transduction histidine kinase
MHKMRFGAHKPTWWPEGETWPPREDLQVEQWRRMRRHFALRAGMGIGCFFSIAIIVGTVVFWTLALTLGWINPASMAAPPFMQPRAGFLWFLLPLGFIAIILWIGVRTFRRAASPIGDLIEAAEKLEGGDTATRVKVRGLREVRALARSFNSMAEKLQVNAEQRRMMLADVTHELRTPLTIMQGNLEGLLDGVYPRDDEHLSILLDETRVMARLIEDLRTLSLAESGQLHLQREETDLAELVNDVIASFRAHTDEAGVTIGAQIEGAPPPLNIDPIRIREVLANLISNALRYTPRDGRVVIKIQGDITNVIVQVSDTGTGISADALEHIFDRFYKSRDSGGSGLGLAIAKQLVQAHGGRINAESTPDQGTTIRFELPVSA